jgi:hypothetical protein
MLTLPRDKRITIRDVDKPLRSMITRVYDRWQGDRVVVQLMARGTAVVTKKEAYTAGVPVKTEGRALNLVTGMWGEAGAGYANIEDGISIVVWNTKSAWSEDRKGELIFFLDKFSADHRDCDALGVARDAILEGDDQRALACARQVLPRTWALYVAIVKKERTMLKGDTQGLS